MEKPAHLIVKLKLFSFEEDRRKTRRRSLRPLPAFFCPKIDRDKDCRQEKKKKGEKKGKTVIQKGLDSHPVVKKITRGKGEKEKGEN